MVKIIKVILCVSYHNKNIRKKFLPCTKPIEIQKLRETLSRVEMFNIKKFMIIFKMLVVASTYIITFHP